MSALNPVTPIAEFSDSPVPLEPTELRAGDSWNWTRQWSDYPSGEYSLSYILNSPLNRFVFPSGGITPDQDGVSFDIQLSPAQTAACVADTYEFVAVLSQAADSGDGEIAQQVTLVLQSVKVLPNLATATAPVDTRSYVKKTLDIIQAAIAGDDRPDVLEYMIQGRSIRKNSRSELLQMEALFRYRYDAERRARGEYVPSRSGGFRFNRAI